MNRHHLPDLVPYPATASLTKPRPAPPCLALPDPTEPCPPGQTSTELNLLDFKPSKPWTPITDTFQFARSPEKLQDLRGV